MKTTDNLLITSIKSTTILSTTEKEFVLTRLTKFDHLDKFKLKRYLLINDERTVKEIYRSIRDKIIREEAGIQFLESQKGGNKNQKLVEKLTPKPDTRNVPVASSVLSDIDYLGHEIPLPPQVRGEPFKELVFFSSLNQLSLLESSHVTFSLDDNAIVLVQKFLNRLTELFGREVELKDKRSYFRLFMRSPLFNCYLNTGITALRHKEIEPRKIVLNLIYQTDPIYLNYNQFEYIAIISNHIKELVEL